MNTISLENMTKEFDGNVILKNVNLTFTQGKIYGVIGRNGAGKSVLLKIISRLYNQTSGIVKYDGSKVDKIEQLPYAVRVFLDKPSFIGNLSGYDNLKLIQKLSNTIDESKIERALKVVNLYEEKDKKFSKYSYGMRQKLGIACCLMDYPKVLILDEPFNGLDDESLELIKSELNEMRENGCIIVIATHIKEDIESFCTDIFEVKNGEVNKR